MRKYNFIRPLLILLVAYFIKNIAASVSLMFGATKELADNIGFLAMIIAVIIMYIRFTRNKRKP